MNRIASAYRSRKPGLDSVHLGCSLWLLTVTAVLAAATATINIDPSKPGPRLNPRMYGIFLEEINHGVDGGLYAELIRNRGFEDAKPPEGFTLRDGRWLDEKGYVDSDLARKPPYPPMKSARA